MSGDPKLLRVRAEIEAILQREDIAAHVILHNAPDQAEIFLRLDPSYSKLYRYQSLPHGVIYRLNSKVADYGGDREAQKRDLEATANMASCFAEILRMSALTMKAMSNQVDAATGAVHSPIKPI